MRYAPDSRPLTAAIVVVGALVLGGCGDDTASPDSSDVPGLDSDVDTSLDDSGGVGTDLTGVTDPQMTAAPNADAGGGGGGTEGGNTDTGGTVMPDSTP